MGTETKFDFKDRLNSEQVVAWINVIAAPQRISRSTVRAWTNRGLRGRKLPVVRLGGFRLFKKADVLRFLGLPEELASVPVPPSEEPVGSAASSSHVTASSGPEPAAR